MNENIDFLIQFDHAEGDTFFYKVLMPAKHDVFSVFGPAMLRDCCEFMIALDENPAKLLDKER